MKPIRNNVIVQEVIKENVTASGIVIQGNIDEQTPAQVISVGDDVTCVQPGDRVILDWRNVRAFKHNNKQYFTIDQQHLLAVYE